MKKIAGFNTKHPHQWEGSLEQAYELIVFFNRFRSGPPTGPTDTHNTITTSQPSQPNHLSPSIPPISPPLQPGIQYPLPTTQISPCTNTGSAPPMVPVPKKASPSGLSDFQPVALTSHVMKVREKLVLDQPRPQLEPILLPSIIVLVVYPAMFYFVCWFYMFVYSSYLFIYF